MSPLSHDGITRIMDLRSETRRHLLLLSGLERGRRNTKVAGLVYMSWTHTRRLHKFSLTTGSANTVKSREIEKLDCVLSKRPRGHIYMVVQVRMSTYSSMYRYG
jgi:hypothetical protein